MAHLPARMAPESGKGGSHPREIYVRLAMPAGILVKVGMSITGTKVDSFPSLPGTPAPASPWRAGSGCCIRPLVRRFKRDRVAPASGARDCRCKGRVSVVGVPHLDADVLGCQVAHLDVPTGGDEATQYVALTLDGGR